MDSKSKGSAYKYITSFFLFGMVLFFLFSGYIIGLHKLPTYGFFRRVELNIFGRAFEQMEKTEELKYYNSIFLRLYKDQADISNRISRKGTGGGLTSFGDAALLLAHDGQIFNIQSADYVHDTTITVPDNGFSAYKRAAESEQFKHLTHAFGIFRYNDILFYQSEKNRGLAISYTQYDSTNTCYGNAVAILPIPEAITSIEQLSAQADDWEVIYRSKPCLPFKRIHYALDGGTAGGRLAFQHPSRILIGNGDYNWNGVFSRNSIAQNPEGEYGKIMSIDLNSRTSHIVATGIRNPQGIVLDNNGTLWTVEHGFRGGDELNRIQEGHNYGWPLESLGTQYSKLPIPNSTAQSYGHHNNYTKPIFSWLPSVAISNLTLVEGFHDSWNGDILMGSLKSRSLFHIRITGNHVLFSEKIEIGERIRYVHQHTDGRLILWTDSKKLIFLTGQPYTDNFVTDYLEENISNEEFRKEIKTAIDACRQCHSIDPGDHTMAPSLALVFNSVIGSTDYKDYSLGLKKKAGTWTRENLKQFLSDPNQFVPGTQMPDPGIQDDTTLEEIINLLEALNTKSPN